MKKLIKIWGIILAFVLVLMVLVMPAPVAAGEMDVGPTYTAGHAVYEAPVVELVTIDVSAPAPAITLSAELFSPTAPATDRGGFTPLVALGVTLSLAAFACKRKLSTILNKITGLRCFSSESSHEGTIGTGGVETKFILPRPA